MPTEELFGNYNFVKGSPRQPGERVRDAAADVDPVRGASRLGGGTEAGAPSPQVVAPEPDAIDESVALDGVAVVDVPFDAADVVVVEPHEGAVIVSDDPDDDGFFDDMMDGTQI